MEVRVVKGVNPDSVEVPSMQIHMLTEREDTNEALMRLIVSLAGKRKRDWFTPHFFYCLPLLVGNQYGFVVLLESSITLSWDGSDSPNGLSICVENPPPGAVQHIHSHFGHGIVTIDHPCVFRTAKGVNLLILAPPNYPVDGLSWMTAVVETDQLRNDFTFNLKITRANHQLRLEAGTPIAHFLPIPRGFADAHQLALHPEGETLENERRAMRDFNLLRHGVCPGALLNQYRLGYDTYGNPLPDHQDR
jgi:hypothetical protein